MFSILYYKMDELYYYQYIYDIYNSMLENDYIANNDYIVVELVTCDYSREKIIDFDDDDEEVKVDVLDNVIYIDD